ncbi:MAG TPA: hypothetical protein VJ583_04260 [Nitrososphaeraceae archaeon]|jgi:hypothetical protein|nr:hypothetical protein [Nitrososphaeraceae archaeon]
MNFIKNITYGFIGGTYGVTGLGIVDGSGQIFAIASVALGGAAMVSALIVRNQIIKRKELDKKIAIEMR